MSAEVITVGDGLISRLNNTQLNNNEEYLGQPLNLQLLEDTLREVLGNGYEGSSLYTVATTAPEEEEEEESPLTEEEMTLLEQVVEEAHQEIPVNSPTLLVDEGTSRFSSAIWYENIQKKVVVLAGVGGIGRFGNLVNF